MAWTGFFVNLIWLDFFADKIGEPKSLQRDVRPIDHQSMYAAKPAEKQRLNPTVPSHGHLQGNVAICMSRHRFCDKLLAILGSATVDASASGLYSNTAPQHDVYRRNNQRFAHLISTNPCTMSGDSSGCSIQTAASCKNLSI
jgi:hypothetical protein